jgi:beta-galactosidase
MRERLLSATGVSALGVFVFLGFLAVAHAQSAPPILLGTAWYPEQWPESRWEADLTLMQQAGIHMVRVGEFAWSRMEPAEGQYDLDWLDRSIAAAGKHGIYTVVGTPTAAPPAWLTQKYPETLLIDEKGKRAEHGNRQQFNFAKYKIPRARPQNCRADGKTLRSQSLCSGVAN